VQKAANKAPRINNLKLGEVGEFPCILWRRFRALTYGSKAMGVTPLFYIYIGFCANKEIITNSNKAHEQNIRPRTA